MAEKGTPRQAWSDRYQAVLTRGSAGEPKAALLEARGDAHI
ncbi:MAG TPA: hypothetical protein VLL28_00150 [Hyphomicrobiaceae bacterium]|nr:hypothetical protein [Hyphomicrobiaceae bacterium]